MGNGFVRNRDIIPLQKEVNRLEKESRRDPANSRLSQSLVEARAALKKLEKQNKKYNAMFSK